MRVKVKCSVLEKVGMTVSVFVSSLLADSERADEILSRERVTESVVVTVIVSVLVSERPSSELEAEGDRVGSRDLVVVIRSDLDHVKRRLLEFVIGIVRVGEIRSESVTVSDGVGLGVGGGVIVALNVGTPVDVRVSSSLNVAVGECRMRELVLLSDPDEVLESDASRLNVIV